MSILSYQDKTKENWFLVSWTLGNKCNYRCPYCPSFLNDGSSGWPEWNDVSNFVEKLKLPNKEICYRISGGEPTYWKRFLDLAKLVKDQGHIFSFLSNGSQKVEYYQEISKYTDGLILTWHQPYADIEHFKKIIQSVDCVTVINMMFSSSNFDESLRISEELYSCQTNIAIWPKVILDKQETSFTNKPDSFTKSQKEILDNWKYFRSLPDQKLHRGNILLDGKEISANELILTEQNTHKGWRCWGGIDGIGIDQWGDVYRSDCLQGGNLGTIKDYCLPQDPIICGKDRCTCLGDIYLRKESQD